MVDWYPSPQNNHVHTIQYMLDLLILPGWSNRKSIVWWTGSSCLHIVFCHWYVIFTPFISHPPPLIARPISVIRHPFMSDLMIRPTMTCTRFTVECTVRSHQWSGGHWQRITRNSENGHIPKCSSTLFYSMVVYVVNATLIIHNVHPRKTWVLQNTINYSTH